MSDPVNDPKSPAAGPGAPAQAGERIEPRVKVNHEFANIDEFIAEYVSDISRSGVFIRTDDPLPVGTVVDLEFTVIVEDFETVRGLGEVVRVQGGESGQPEGMGVVFTQLTSVSEGLIDRLLIKR